MKGHRPYLIMAVVALVATALIPLPARADIVYQSDNVGFSPGVFYLAQSSGTIGWYWTPGTDVNLTGIATKVNTVGSNINNNFTMTVTVYTDRPAAGGTSLGSFSFAVHNITGLQGGAFATPISLTGGNTYFLGFSGWDQVLSASGGGGVNYLSATDITNPSVTTFGLNSSYSGSTFNFPLNSTSLPQTTEYPILQFTAVKPVPLPGTLPLVLTGIGVLVAWRRPFY